MTTETPEHAALASAIAVAADDRGLAPSRSLDNALAEELLEELDKRGFRVTLNGEYARVAAAIRHLLDEIDDMAIRNTDVDDAAHALRLQLVDAGWDEDPQQTGTLDT